VYRLRAPVSTGDRLARPLYTTPAHTARTNCEKPRMRGALAACPMPSVRTSR